LVRERSPGVWEVRVVLVRAVPEEDWLFSPSPRRSAYLTAGALSRRLTRLGPASGVEHAALHHLRRRVATYLVDQGLLLKAHARLGHRDPATTLRHYSHAIPHQADRLRAVPVDRRWAKFDDRQRRTTAGTCEVLAGYLQPISVAN